MLSGSLPTSKSNAIDAGDLALARNLAGLGLAQHTNLSLALVSGSGGPMRKQVREKDMLPA